MNPVIQPVQNAQQQLTLPLAETKPTQPKHLDFPLSSPPAYQPRWMRSAFIRYHSGMAKAS